jgi:hypothetical protein
MPRLKKKYMEKHAQPLPVRVAPVVRPEAAVPVVDMTLKDAAKRYGVKVKSI